MGEGNAKYASMRYLLAMNMADTECECESLGDDGRVRSLFSPSFWVKLKEKKP